MLSSWVRKSRKKKKRKLPSGNERVPITPLFHSDSLSAEKPKEYDVIPRALSNSSVLKRQPYCDICKALYFKAKSSYVCIQCQKLLCNGCRSKHGDDDMFFNHSVLSLEGSDGTTLQCPAHPQENTMLYCNTCAHPICVVCALSVHDDHHKNNFKEHVDRQRTAIKSLLQESQVSQQEGFLLKQQLEQQLDSNRDDLQEAKNSITTYKNMLVKTLETRHDTIQKDLENMFAEKETEMENTIDILHDRMFHLLDHSNMAKQIVDNDIKLVNLNDKFTANFKEAVDIGDDLAEQVKNTIRPRFVPSYDINLGVIVDTDSTSKEESPNQEFYELNPLKIAVSSDTSSSLGFHDDNYLSSNPNSEFTSPREGLRTMSPNYSGIKSERFQEELGLSLSRLPAEILEETFEDGNTSEDDVTPLLSPRAGLVNATLDFCKPDNKTETQLLYTIDYKGIVSSDPSGFDKYQTIPIDIAFKNEHKILITQWGVIPTTKNIGPYPPRYYPAKVGMVLYSLCHGEPSVEKCFEDCSPWSVTAYDGLYYVTDNRYTQRTVRKYMDNGELLGGWPAHRMTHPRGIAITNDDKIIITDISNKQIRVFNEDEVNNPDIQLKLGQPGRYSWVGSHCSLNTSFYQDGLVDDEDDVLFKEPQFVTTNSLGWMIISDTGDDKIKVFTLNGHKLFEISLFAHEMGEDFLSSPMGVITDFNDNIYVADYGNDRVVKFNNDGEFLETILNSDIGGIYQPRGLAFHNSLLAISCSNEVGEPQVKIFNMGTQLEKSMVVYRCPCDWLRLCAKDEVTKL